MTTLSIWLRARPRRVILNSFLGGGLAGRQPGTASYALSDILPLWEWVLQTRDSAPKPLPLPPLQNSVLSIHGPQEYWLYSPESEPGTWKGPSGTPTRGFPSHPARPRSHPWTCLFSTHSGCREPCGVREPREPGSHRHRHLHHHHCAVSGPKAGASLLLCSLC